MFKLAVLLCCCAAALAQNCGRPKNSPDAGYRPGQRIVGGTKAAPASHPWIGGLVKAEASTGANMHFCGSTLINNQWLVTAGHCVVGDDFQTDQDYVDKIKIVLGENNMVRAFQSGNLRAIAGVFKNEDYIGEEGRIPVNDVALIKLAEPVQFSSTIMPACRPSAPISAITSKTMVNPANKRRIAFVAGWGAKYEGQKLTYEGGDFITPTSEDLLQVAIEMYAAPECKNLLTRSYGVADASGMDCGGYAAGGKDSCQGDSGGPLVCKNDKGLWEHCGVVSAGPGCARANQPGVYADAYAYKDWIDQTIAANS